MNNYKIIFLVSLSALLLGSAFFLPQYCACFIFIFLIPLYYGIVKYPAEINSKHGLLWGIIFVSINMGGIAYVCIEHSTGVFRYCAVLFFIFYFCLYSQVWFSVTQWMARRFKYEIPAIITCWTLSTLIILHIYKSYTMWLFGIYGTGNCLSLILLPLAEHPWLMSWLRVFGEAGLLFLLVMSQILLAVCLAKKELKYCAGALGLLPFFIGFFYWPAHLVEPEYVRTLGYIKPPPRNSSLFSLEKAMAIDFQIDALTNQFPQIKNIVMPEACLNASINSNPELMDLLTEHSYDKDINIIIGAYRASENKKHNSLYLIQQGQIRNFYDKNVCMPFMEYVPFPWNYLGGCKNLFMKNRNAFSLGHKTIEMIQTSPAFSFIPCICSELFLGNDQIFTHANPHTPILVIVNEMWFSAKYIRHLMLLYARYKAMQYEKDLIYVGHTIACWINGKNGEIINLNR